MMEATSPGSGGEASNGSRAFRGGFVSKTARRETQARPAILRGCSSPSTRTMVFRQGRRGRMASSVSMWARSVTMAQDSESLRMYSSSEARSLQSTGTTGAAAQVAAR